MSDQVIISIVGGIVSLVSLMVTAWMKITLTKLQKEINGHMTNLLTTTKKLATANEKAKHRPKRK